MREILFRGKRSKQSDFIYGSLHVHPESGACAIFCKDRGVPWYCYNEVLPETVGQYTGLTDKNGKKIFEGDIVNLVSEVDEPPATIEFDKETARYVIQADGFVADFDNYWSYELEIIGNIHDDPKLMEGGNG